MRIDTAPYIVGTWGEENYVGSYTDAARQKAEEEDRSAEADEEDEGWSAEADEEDEGWSAEADEEDEGWSAEADEEDEGWSAEADEEDDDRNAEADKVGIWQDAASASDIEPFGDTAMSYLDRIRLLCEERGIPLLLVKAPSVSPVWYDVWEKQITNYADTYNINYINYL